MGYRPAPTLAASHNTMRTAPYPQVLTEIEKRAIYKGFFFNDNHVGKQRPSGGSGFCDPLLKELNKAGYTATPVACGWAGAVIEVNRSFEQEQ